MQKLVIEITISIL